MADSWAKIQWVVIFLLLISFTMGVGLYTDYLWFQSVGYVGVFSKILISKIILGLGGSAALFLVVFTSVFAASLGYSLSKTKKGDTEIIVPEKINSLVLGVTLAVSLLFGLSVSGSWETVLRFLNRQSFGVSDPVFGLDVSFYIFELPLYRAFLSVAFFALIVTGIITLFVYLLKSKSILFDLAFSDIKFETPSFTARAKAHLFLLLSLFFVLLALKYRLDAYELLLSSRSQTFFGPGYTDLTVTLPALNAMAILSIITAAVVLLNIWIKNPKIPALTVVLIVAVHLLILGLYAGVVQEYRVKPNEIKLETPYISDNIKYTTQAFGLDEVEIRTFDVTTNLSAADIEENRGTIDNIRLWDPRPLKDTYRQIQEIRLYYEFNDVDVDRYSIDGDYVELMLSAREIVPTQLPESARNWINEHLFYTHGYGVVASPVNMVTKEGLPELFVKDIPPISGYFNITRPEIYFGERTDNYVLVNTALEEFDYPKGDENEFTTYGGDAGVLLDSYVKRLAMSIRFGTTRIILSRDITPESRILFNRNIRKITSEITPFLTYDRDPYIVVSEGKVYWILDGYTTSTNYPYSTPHPEINYIRNPVKVVIDTYSGSTRFYVIDEADPILKTYRAIFPGVFLPFSAMPEDLRAHLRYPEDMFTMQSIVYAKYHMKNPRVFYNLEDMWNIPNELYENRRTQMVPYYIIMKLPGEEREEFIIMLPFTPRNKDNMISWMYARSDGDNYGKIGVFNFPKQELIFGPMQIEARIDQDSRISEQLTLWGQVGSRVIRGNLLVIPVENSILYVEPLYLLAEESQLPELKRVIVAFGNRIVMEEDLEKSLSSIFGAREIPAEEREILPPLEGDLEAQALDRYRRALEELKRGNWSGFGDELNTLGAILEELEKREAS